MDIQTGLLCMAFASISGVIIYFMLSLYSKSTFEEAKAKSQKIKRQFHEENKITSDKIKDKKLKKNHKKVKDKKDAMHAVAGDHEELENDTTKERNTNEMISESNETSNAVRKTKLVEKEEILEVHVNPIENESIPQLNTMVSTKVKVISRKDNKRKKVNEKDNDKNLEQTKENHEINLPNVLLETRHDEITTLISQNTQASEISQKNLSKKSSKKKQTDVNTINQLKNGKEAVSINLLISLIEKAELSRSEIQTIIEKLLNKQDDYVPEWYDNRQDPVVKLKKQLNDLEQSLKDEKELNLGLQTKLKDIRFELVNERGTNRIIEEQTNVLQTELKTLTHKLHNVNEENHLLSINVQQLQKKLNDEEIMIKLKDEQMIKQRMNDDKNHETVINLQAKVNQLSAKLQENNRIIEDYQKMQSEMSRVYEGSQFNVKDLQGKVITLERALTDAKTEIEKHIISNKDSFDQNEHLTNQLKTQCQEMKILREKNESLAKMNAENWENGFSYNNKQGFAEMEARLEEKNQHIEQVNNELELTKNKMNELSLNLLRCKSDNMITQTLLDTANEDILKLQEKIKETKLQEDMIVNLKTAVNERNENISFLKLELDGCKQRNNELRSKNWKIVDALTKTEKTLQNKIRNDQNLSGKGDVNLDVEKIHETMSRLVKRLYPDFIIEEKLESISDWLDNLENAVMSNSTIDKNITNSQELQSQINHLQALVVHYKGIITDTERMLNQLQKHVEIEETKWKETITSLKEELNKEKTKNQKADIL